MLRRYFLYDRKLLSGLSRCGWENLKTFFKCTTSDPKAVRGTVSAIQSFGNFLGLKRTLQQAAGNLPREEFYLFSDSLANPAASCGECAHYRGSILTFTS
jgi:hypothetical protein